MWRFSELDEVQKGLLDHGIIAIGGEVNGEMAKYVRESTLRLRAKGSPPIELHISSNGGGVDAGLAIYDLLIHYPGEITGIVYGYAKSMAAIILQACAHRWAAEHSQILIHHISRTEISLDTLRDPQKTTEAREDLEKKQSQLYRILTERTRRSLEEIKAECSKDREMTPEEAKEFRLIDEIFYGKQQEGG